MTDRPTKLFLRWRQRGDADALAAVFDLVAPELLRVALHLVGNVADAEDLLQATFVAAIESAERFERGRRVTPWLVAILTHAAQAERRRQRRATPTGVDADAAPGPHADPARSLAQHDLAEASMRALDALPEPYRQPTMLRVAHGMQPAAIALLLGRSPGAVRVQIHRGLELVRRRVPAGAWAALAGNVAGRGMAAVKSAVLSHALATKAVVLATSTATLLTGGVFMGKKTLGLAAVLLAGLAAVIAFASHGDASAVQDDAVPTVVAAPQVDAEMTSPISTQPSRPAAAERTALAYDPGPDAWQLRARVVDGMSKAPISGATVALFGPRMMTLLELQREFGDFGHATPNGAVDSAGARIPAALDAGVVAGGVRGSFLAPPAADQPTLARQQTDKEGCFELPVPRSGSVLAVSCAGHGERILPVDSGDGSPLTIELWPLHRLLGEVRTATGEVPDRPLQLLLTARDSGRYLRDASRDAWLVSTDAAGRFTAEVAADRVMVSCRTRGWAIVQHIIDPETRYLTVHSRSLDVASGGTVYVVRYGCATLHVTDAQTHEPIETIWVTSRSADGRPQHCGQFCAPGGYFALSPEDAGFEFEGLSSPGEARDTREATVWSNGYAPAQVESVQLFSIDPPTVEVRLQRGNLPRLEGTLSRSGRAAGGVRTQLRFFDQDNRQHSTDLFVATAITTNDGSFCLAAPAGEYLLEVVAEARLLLQQPVTLPATGPRLLDLDSQVWVTVEVVDEHDSPVTNHNVAVRDEGGKHWIGKTGPDGRATFGPCDPGTLRAKAPLLASETSWQGQVFASVDAAAGSHPLLQLRLPSRLPLHARLAFDGPTPEHGFAGFQARDVSVGVIAKDVAVAEDGTVPIDLLQGAELWITGPEQRQWRFTLAMGLKQDPTLVLRWSGLAYAGVLRDSKGTPLARTKVHATPIGGGVTVSVTTDSGGAFRLDGLEPQRYSLWFQMERTDQFGRPLENPLRSTFEAHELPSTVAVQLEPRVPRFVDGAFVGCEQVAITGKVRDAGGAIVANARIGITSLIDQQGGVLTLFGRSQVVGADGSFHLTVPRGERYRSSVSRIGSENVQTAEWQPASGAAEIEHDIIVK